MKTCSKCSLDLPLESFQRDARRLDGRRAECGECKNRALRAFRTANAAQVRARDRKRVRPDAAATLRRWRQANRESARRSVAKWRKANPWFGRAKYHRREARKRATGGTLSAADIKLKLDLQGHRCAYCRAALRIVGSHTDHIVALANGGANDRSNIQMLCPSCNTSKGAKCPIAYRQSLGFLL